VVPRVDTVEVFSSARNMALRVSHKSEKSTKPPNGLWLSGRAFQRPDPTGLAKYLGSQHRPVPPSNALPLSRERRQRLFRRTRCVPPLVRCSGVLAGILEASR
jgi:hypothetical protein